MMEKILQMIFSAMVWFLIKVNLFPNVLVWKLKEIAWSMQSTVHVSLCLQSSLTGKFDNLRYTRLLARTILFSIGSNFKFQSHLCSLYHTRVWKIYPFKNVRIRSIWKPDTTQKNEEECYFTQCYICSQHSEKYSVFPQ